MAYLLESCGSARRANLISMRSETRQMIQAFSTLALNSGQPAFSSPLHVGRPNIGNRERLLERINDLLDRRWLTNDGPYVQELESRIAAVLGVKNCIAMCNATVALEIA